MINALPIVGWILSFVGNFCLAVPFWFIWTHCELGKFYFGEWLPDRFESIPFWNCVGLFMVASILNARIPKIVSVSNDNKNEK